jgi:glycine/D-amino acid oxidase-like deaminating enzyme
VDSSDRRYTHGVYAQTARPAPATPPLVGEVEAEVAIVGGGYTGLSAALHLAERGIGAIVLEAQEPGFGASGRNGGHVNPGLYVDPDGVIAKVGETMGRRMLDAASSAPDFTFDLIGRLGIACEAERKGTIRAGYHESWLPGIRSSLAQLERTGSPARWIGREELRIRTGTPRYLGGIFFPQGGMLNPLSYARGLAAAAVAAGAIVHGGSRVVRLEQAGDRWRLTTAQARVTARHVVLATNGYTDGLWPGLERSIVPVFSTIAASEPLGAERLRSIMPGGSVLYESGLNTVYYRVDAGGRLLMGGRSVQRPVRGVDDARHLIAYARQLWPALDGVPWTEAWNGRVAVTQDKLIHLHEPAPGMIAALGYNGRGVAMATVMGSVIARRIAGEPVEDLPLPVTRIEAFPFRRFARLGVQARLVYGRVRDRLGV